MSNRLKYRKVDIKYYPTEKNIGNYFTKTLQGAKFGNFKGKILNIQISDDGPFPKSGTRP